MQRHTVMDKLQPVKCLMYLGLHGLLDDVAKCDIVDKVLCYDRERIRQKMITVCCRVEILTCTVEESMFNL